MIAAINTFFQKIGDYFAQLSTLPAIIIGLIILGVIIMLITIIVIIMSVRQGIKKKAQMDQVSSAIAKDPNQEEKEAQKKSKNLPPLAGPFSDYFIKKGFVQVSDLSKSFLAALNFLRSALNSPNYKYRLPWYLLIGSESSGKSSLIEGSTLNLPVGIPGIDEKASSIHFLEKATVGL